MHSEGYSTGPAIPLSFTTFSATTHNKVAKKWYQWIQCHTGLILKMAICLVLCSKWKPSEQANMQMSIAYLDQIPSVLSMVEAVEVLRRASMWCWFGKNTTYWRS